MPSYTGATCAQHWQNCSAFTSVSILPLWRYQHKERMILFALSRTEDKEPIMAYDLEFEKPLADLEKKIAGLQRKGDRLKPDEHAQLQEAERELRHRTQEIYSKLTAWQTVLVARHKDRPYSLDLI